MADDTDSDPKQTILVVDDNEPNRVLAANTLEDEGYRVVLAGNGTQGLAAYETERPDCIVLDVRMPDLDGFAVCERIRAMPGGDATPVIFLTALRDVDTFDHALRAGGDDFVTKPVRPAELVVRVSTALKLRRLRSELHEHYNLLKQQRDDVMRLQFQKERLMAFVVHDLKNPVNSMDLHAQLVLRDKTLSESTRRSVVQIRTEARQLSRMILNLLDLSKGDEGKLSPRLERTSIAPLISEIFGELAVQADARDVRLVSQIEAEQVYADEDLLRRTLANLIENAIRHAPTASSVTVRTQKHAAETEISVSDTGAGIPQELRDSVFDPFVQLDASRAIRSGSGRGLGLAFCKLVAVAHGASITVEDAEPGARFHIRFQDERT